MQISAANLFLSLHESQTALGALPTQGGADILSLTRRLARGEEEAFREFHGLYFDRLYQFLLVVARGQEHEAEEALQETLLRVLRYVRAFETEEVFWSWLKVVARSAARDSGRKQRRYLGLLRNFALHWQNHGEDQTRSDNTPLGGLLEEGLTKLSPEDRRLIEGKYVEGATVKELAAFTGLTDKAVESRLLRARHLVREFILTKLKTS